MTNSAVVRSRAANGQAAATSEENLDDMYARLWAGSVSSSVWLMNQDVWPAIFSLNEALGSGGYPMFIAPGEYDQAPNGMILGRPVIPIEFAQTCGTQGDIVAGRPQPVHHHQQRRHRAGPIDSRRVPHRPDRPAVHDAGRRLTWENSPVTPFHDTNTQSSFVALATRT